MERLESVYILRPHGHHKHVGWGNYFLAQPFHRHARVHRDVVRAVARLESFVDNAIRDIATRGDGDGTVRERVAAGMFEARQSRPDCGKRRPVHPSVRGDREHSRRRVPFDPAAWRVLVPVLEDDGGLAEGDAHGRIPLRPKVGRRRRLILRFPVARAPAPEYRQGEGRPLVGVAAGHRASVTFAVDAIVADAPAVRRVAA